MIRADEWPDHIEDVFGTVVCTRKQTVVLTSTMFRGGANTWGKSAKDKFRAMPSEGIWEAFKKQFQRKFVPEHVQQQKESEFLNTKQGRLTVAECVCAFLQLGYRVGRY